MSFVVDLGMHWRQGTHTYRVSWKDGELYAHCHQTDEKETLGHFPSLHDCYAVMQGWVMEMDQPDSLKWIKHRISVGA
jgi:hypothetical protein